MGLKIDSIQKSLPTLEAKTQQVTSDSIAIYNPKVDKPVDRFVSRTNQTGEKEDAQKSSTKNILIGVGIALGAVAVGVGAAYLLKNKTFNFADEIAKFKDINIFKKLKISKNLTSSEQMQALNVLTNYGNQEIFLATLKGTKPTALLSECKQVDNVKDLTINVLEKLNLGKNFTLVDGEVFAFSGRITKNKYLFNNKEVLNIIKQNKEIFALRLNLPESTPIKEIYKALIQSCKNNNGKMADDLLGLTLGFPKFDSIIYHLEKCGKILSKDRLSPDFKEKLIAVLRGSDSPYKGLPEKILSSIESMIQKISTDKLKNIATQGSFNNELYQFINYVDDPVELARINKTTENFFKTFNTASL